MSASGGRVARRYARALLGASVKADSLDRVEADLQAIGSAIGSSPALADALASPELQPARKREVVGKAFAGADQLTLAFVDLLVSKGREAELADVCRVFQSLVDETRGVVRATATCAMEVTPAQHASLLAGLEKRTGKKVDLTVQVDPHVLGGVVVRLDDVLIDGSVRGALERIHEHMLGER